MDGLTMFLVLVGASRVGVLLIRFLDWCEDCAREAPNIKRASSR